MKHFFVVALIAALSMLVGGDSGADALCQAVMRDGVSKEELAQQPCCQRNQGICGCRAGKIVCCDKTFSPNCKC